MRRTARLLVPFLTAYLIIPGGGAFAAGSAVVRTPASASYRVHLTSDRQGHTWTGGESISFTNVSSRSMHTVWLHLWSNGVKGCRAGAIEVSHVTGGTLGGPILRCTSVPVRLRRPLAEGDSTTISMSVRIQLFQRDDRFGFSDGVSLLGTALPTLGVRDDFGWNLNPFVDLGESFYSVVSNYRVTLDTPRSLRTPATGVLASASRHGGRIARTYVANDVRDFEWAAARFQHLVGSAGQTRVNVWYPPNFVTQDAAKSARADAIRSMRTFSRDFGAYPYPEIDVVLPGFHGFSGMEYPTIVFSDPTELNIAHELAHQWFYGLVGNDQFREPWLDESFATWASDLPNGGTPSCDTYYWPNDEVRLNSSMAYFRRVPEAYGVVYDAGSCMLSQLSDRFGADAFLALLRSYVTNHSFGVVRTSDFKHAVAAAARTQLPGFDLQSFWHTWRLDHA